MRDDPDRVGANVAVNLPRAEPVAQGGGGEHVVLQLADDPEQKLVTFTADGSQQQRIAQLIADQDT